MGIALWKKALAVVGMLAAAGNAMADTAGAAAAYKRGQQYQTAKQWGGAVKEYQAALKEDPKYFYAYKALGTTYYQAGDKKGALSYYDRYLAMNPSDAATKAFAEKLRGELGAKAPAQAAKAAATGDKKSLAGVSVYLDVPMVMADGSDVAKFHTTGNKPQGAMALGYGLGVDYGLKGGFVIGASLLMGPNRSHSVEDTTDNGFMQTKDKYTYDISHMHVMLNTGWRFKLGQSLLLTPLVGLGYETSTLAYKNEYTSTVMGSSSVSTFSTKLTGSGFAIWPQLKAEYMFGRFGLGGSLGYLMASSSPMKDDKGNEAKVATPGGTPTPWALSTSGVSFGVQLVFHFSPLK
jgi:hypothetical protein